MGDHRDHHTTFATLEEAGVDAKVIADLKRTLLEMHTWNHEHICNRSELSCTLGIREPLHCGQRAGQNHKAMVKGSQKGFTLVLGIRVALLMLHFHLTPQGIVDLNTLKNLHCIFDGTFQPSPWRNTINDWASKE